MEATTAVATVSATELYSSLHRGIDNGEQSETNWARLAVVCIELDKKDEALQAFENVKTQGLRRDVQRRLADKGWAERVRRDATAIVTVTEADLNPSVREKLWDAVRFLADGNVRMAVLACTLAFPVVLVLGGFLMASGPAWLMRAAAAVPALLAAGLAGAYGRQIFVQALRASDDTTDVPSLVRMVPQALRFVVDFAVLSFLFLAPGSAACLLGQRWLGLLLLLPAAALLPMAASVRFLRNDWRGLKPAILFGAVRRCPSYPGVALMIALLFAPALVAFVIAVGKPLYLLIAVVGPLAAAPYFAAMRMMGLTLHYHNATVRNGGGKKPEPVGAQ